MIQVYIIGEKKPHEFNTPQVALRFMYMMRNKGYIIESWACDDPLDAEWLYHRFR
jgi:hypothetical protein